MCTVKTGGFVEYGGCAGVNVFAVGVGAVDVWDCAGGEGLHLFVVVDDGKEDSSAHGDVEFVVVFGFVGHAGGDGDGGVVVAGLHDYFECLFGVGGHES